MKNYLKYLGAVILALMLFGSCEKEPIGRDSVDVTFAFDLMTDVIKKDGTQIVNGLDIVCSDELPTRVEVVIDGNTYDLALQTSLEEGTQTEPVKLAPGPHTISKFLVKDANGAVIYATPEGGSEYQVAFAMQGTDVSFDTEAFDKKKVTMEVLCFTPTRFQQFGFNWFQFENYAVKTLCFFGDICTDLYEEWHAYQGAVANPYATQAFDGYDFAAMIKVEIASNGQVLSSNNYADLGKAPVCVEYLDDLAVDGEAFQADIYLLLPDGSEALLGSVPFTDADQSDSNLGANSFGGEDGILDFTIGNCDPDNPGTYAIPRFPDTKVWMTIKGDGAATDNHPSYVDIKFRVDGFSGYSDIVDGAILDGWCVELDWHISYNVEYEINLYSSLDRASMPQYLQDKFTQARLDALNYIANVTLAGTYNKSTVQDAIWYFTGDMTTPNSLAQSIEMAVSGGYTVPIGGQIFVILEPVNDPAAKIQIMTVRNPNE